MKKKWQDHLGFDPNRAEVRMVVAAVESHLGQRVAHPGWKLEKHYALFEDWVREINSPDGALPAPATANGVFQVSQGDFNGPNWVWMHTQGVFKQSAITGAVLGSILAFLVILAATRQIIIASAALMTIGGVLVSVLAMMQIAGYELGTITSIAITILAGFAVDYVVHLAHAYESSEKQNRWEKAQ